MLLTAERRVPIYLPWKSILRGDGVRHTLGISQKRLFPCVMQVQSSTPKVLADLQH